MIEPASVEEDTGLVRIEGARDEGAFVIPCDHASNRIPPGFGDPGLGAVEMQRHIAWDPGALAVARGLAHRLGCPLIYPDASRLLIDCNRPPDSPASVLLASEDTDIPGNRDLDPALRARRVSEIYDAYHDAIDALLDERAAAGVSSAMVAVHSFTPVYRGTPRPWHVGVLFNADRRLADRLREMLVAEADLIVGDNEPYSPSDGVYHTLTRHAEARGLPCVMIEIANDLLSGEADQACWAERLARALPAALESLA